MNYYATLLYDFLGKYEGYISKTFSKKRHLVYQPFK